MHPANAGEWISRLGLGPHPEGGHYKETYRSAGSLGAPFLPERATGERAYSTAIYFLLREGEVSHWHRLRSDELWFHHAGDSLEIEVVSEDHSRETHRLGVDLAAGETPQRVVPARDWFGSRIRKGPHGYALVSCVVAPGFDFRDFALPAAGDLARFPELLTCPDLVPGGAGS